MIGTCNENLFHFRFNGKSCGSYTFRVYGNFSVSKHFKTKLISSAIENIAAFLSQPDILGEENDTHPITAEGRKMHPKLDTFIEKEFVWDLDHDTGSIACIGFTSAGTPVLHVLEHCKRIAHDLV